MQVQAEGFSSITTQIFDSDCKYLDNDSVFAVKDNLSVVFQARENDPKAKFELEYDMAVSPTT